MHRHHPPLQPIACLLILVLCCGLVAPTLADSPDRPPTGTVQLHGAGLLTSESYQLADYNRAITEARRDAAHQIINGLAAQGWTGFDAVELAPILRIHGRPRQIGRQLITEFKINMTRLYPRLHRINTTKSAASQAKQILRPIPAETPKPDISFVEVTPSPVDPKTNHPSSQSASMRTSLIPLNSAKMTGEGVSPTNKPVAPTATQTPAFDAPQLRITRPATASEPATAPTPAPITGVIVDARGTGFRPGLTPRILGPAGVRITDVEQLELQHLLDRGAVTYATTLESALADPAVGANPVHLRARSESPNNSLDLTLSAKELKLVGDANALKAFWVSHKLVILVDEPETSANAGWTP